ncbi:hypothetical protein GOP47_0016479 [Adiantum capillus-veneris]|uniref:Beta-tubulin n=1 Tax=Adiantum capillus-veneris TaxID=13818 RepID=A0A9D4UHR5_ADICA|nr:hypothetical protein GOP47_0016479 [Adiantum capillus-veneris]
MDLEPGTMDSVRTTGPYGQIFHRDNFVLWPVRSWQQLGPRVTTPKSRSSLIMSLTLSAKRLKTMTAFKVSAFKISFYRSLFYFIL